MAKGDNDKLKFEAPVSAEDKARVLEAARLQIEKQFGTGSLIKLGDHINAAGIEAISSGSILLDEALGIGGYPRGRIVEIYGLESSGKTTLALHAIAEAQKAGGIAAFIDAEHALDPIYARNLGVNVDDLYVSQPDTGEQALEIADSLVRSGAVDVIVVDSVAALVPQAEIEGEMGDAHMGLQARLMSQALRKLTATIGKSRTILIFINQIRMKIGVMFGNPETTTGGNALKFYSSIRLEVRKGENIEGADGEVIGNRARVKVAKNKVAPPFRKCELEIMFGKGVSSIAGLLDAAIKYEIIDKKGSWFSYGTDKIAQGRESAKAYLEEHEDVRTEIEDKLREVMFPERRQKANGPEKGKTAKDKGQSGTANAGNAAANVPAVNAPAARVPAAAITGRTDGGEAKRSAGRPRKNPVEENSDEPLF
jgi:recombination protein RecA